METKDAREARRRKLLTRGSDRLAFITGQSRSLSEPDPPSPQLSAGSSVHAKFIEPQEIGTASIEGLTDEPTVISPTTNEVFTTSVSSSRAAQIIGGTSSEINNSSNIVLNNNSNIALRAKGNITLKEISYSISTSENIRMMCSVIIALFTVILNHGFSLSVKFKPLVLVVITDLTVIFGLALRGQVGESRRRVQNVDGGIMNIGNVIEGAILFQKAMAAISLDCCICAIIMICALAV